MTRTTKAILVLSLAFVLGVLGLTAVLAHERGAQRKETLNILTNGQRENCEDLNALRANLRSILVRSRAIARQAGTITPSGEMFYEDSIKDIQAVNCLARTPD